MQHATPDALESIVRHLLSVVIGRGADEIRSADRLGDDLDMDAVAIAKVFMVLEDVACAEFPAACLCAVDTVRDLTDAWRALIDARLAAEPLEGRNVWPSIDASGWRRALRTR